MSLIDQVKLICDRLAPLGWQELLLAVTNGSLDISKVSAAALENPVPKDKVNRKLPGFEDYHSEGNAGIVPSKPAHSLLYHALASPRVLRDAAGAVLRGFPTAVEIETVENYVFAARKQPLSKVVEESGATKLALVVFASEYRPAPDTVDGAHADLVFSRTGLSRIGTARPKYRDQERGFWPEDEDNPHGFRVIPARFGVWLAAHVTGSKARVMRLNAPDAAENSRKFWVPVHKLFDGAESLSGLTLALQTEAHFFNMKLQRVMKSLPVSQTPTTFPFVIKAGLASLQQNSDLGSLVVVPEVQQSLVMAATKADGTALTYKVPTQAESSRFATYQTESPEREGDKREIHPFPAYVHARTKIVAGSEFDLNDEVDVDGAVTNGGYDAQLYIDFTGEGWVSVKVAQLEGNALIQAQSRPAYVILSAPDFFPSSGQRELSRWAASSAIPKSFRANQLWGVSPLPLSEERLPANLQLPASPFDAKETGMTAIVGIGAGAPATTLPRFPDVRRSSTLPDDAAGVFAPGWDASVDVKGDVNTGTVHLATYGLGSPFPEDAKLCAALSTFWPAVAPDVYRTFSPHTGNSKYRGTVAPLTDEEIGKLGTLPWDGVQGPKLVEIGGSPFVEMASFLHTDYVRNASENRFSIRLTARIGAEEYQQRVLSAARVHWVLSGGKNVWPERTRWLLLSFISVSTGLKELQDAQKDAGYILSGPVYRVDACFLEAGDPTIDSPRGPKFRLLPVKKLTQFFVSPFDPRALLKRETAHKWDDVPAE